ncbi:DNA-binding protein [Bradyrhizobium stylosanthis]|uniref:DNA-binding protein n=1 Tax=Bradyrhizobium stylosanthis TaxID=1803665 RepID=UPI000B2EC9C1|nr:DNA-binding protein [Bradyrhizobium stylosanthis]
MMTETELAADLLRGVKSIAEFINEDVRATNYKLTTGQLPGGKDGREWVASKQVLRQHYAKITTAGKAA